MKRKTFTETSTFDNTTLTCCRGLLGIATKINNTKDNNNNNHNNDNSRKQIIATIEIYFRPIIF